jgi:predicted dehydrogenase
MSQKRRALVVGAGGLARSAWEPTIRQSEGAEIAGWIDIVPGAAEEAAQAAGLEQIYTGTDLDQALQTVQPDFVLDVTVPSAHRNVTIRSLEFGVPVLGEKPMSDSMESAREMVAASDRTGKLYVVSQMRRYDENLVALKGLIDQTVGPLGILNSDFYIGAHFGPLRHGLRHVLLVDMGVHIFDAARFLSGADPVSVYCDEFNPPWDWHQGYSSATCVFEMEGGIRYTFRGSWASEGFHTSWESEWRAVGARGTAVWDGRGTPAAETPVETDQFVWDHRLVVAEPTGGPKFFAGSLAAFLHALDTGETPWGECHDNLKTLAMAFSAIESAGEGRKVPVET